jgi:hypothetical protein
MLISDLEEMENIVSSNDNLAWNGWDVVSYTKNGNAMFSQNAEYRDGQWYKTKVFPITEDGWNIPNNIGRGNEQVEG